MEKKLDKNTKEKEIDVWLKINVKINNELEKLKQADKEREEIGKNLATLPENELINQMDESIKKYEQILANITLLKTQAEKLKNKIKGKK